MRRKQEADIRENSERKRTGFLPVKINKLLYQIPPKKKAGAVRSQVPHKLNNRHFGR